MELELIQPKKPPSQTAGTPYSRCVGSPGQEAKSVPLAGQALPQSRPHPWHWACRSTPAPELGSVVGVGLAVFVVILWFTTKGGSLRDLTSTLTCLMHGEWMQSTVGLILSPRRCSQILEVVRSALLSSRGLREEPWEEPPLERNRSFAAN